MKQKTDPLQQVGHVRAEEKGRKKDFLFKQGWGTHWKNFRKVCMLYSHIQMPLCKQDDKHLPGFPFSGQFWVCSSQGSYCIYINCQGLHCEEKGETQARISVPAQQSAADQAHLQTEWATLSSSRWLSLLADA